MELTDEFPPLLNDQDEDTVVNYDASYFKNSIGNHDIIELKGNFIPKGIVPLEIFFLTMIPYWIPLCSHQGKMMWGVLLVLHMNLSLSSCLKHSQMSRGEDTSRLWKNL